MKDKFFTALENLIETTDRTNISKHRESFMANSAFLVPVHVAELSETTVIVRDYANDPTPQNKSRLIKEIEKLKSLT